MEVDYNRSGSTSGFAEYINVPPIIIKCKQTGFYTLTVGLKLGSSHASTQRNMSVLLNAKEIKYNVFYHTGEAWMEQYHYNVYLKRGDVLTLKHKGGSYNSITWNDDQIYVEGSDRNQSWYTNYSISAIIWNYIPDTSNGIITTITPTPATNNFTLI